MQMAVACDAEAASSSSDDTLPTEAMQRGSGRAETPPFPALAFGELGSADDIRKFLIGAITSSSPRMVKLLGVSLALFAGGLAGVQSAAWTFRSFLRH